MKKINKRVIRNILIIVLVLVIILTYGIKRYRLEKEYEFWLFRDYTQWFDIQTCREIGYANEIEYDLSELKLTDAMIEAVANWDAEGLDYFCNYENDIVAETAQGALVIEEHTLAVNEEYIGRSNPVYKKFGEEAIANALIRILFGDAGWSVGKETYYSSYESVLDIEPKLFLDCMEIVDREAPHRMKDSAIIELWYDAVREIRQKNL